MSKPEFMLSIKVAVTQNNKFREERHWDLMELKNTTWELHNTTTVSTTWELHNATTSTNNQTDQAEKRIWAGRLPWNKTDRQDWRKKNEKEQTKPPGNMRLCEKTKPTFDGWTWKWWGEWSQVGKHSSVYYPGEHPQPSKTGQHSNSGNAEKNTKIFLEKSNHADLPRLKWRKKC